MNTSLISVLEFIAALVVILHGLYYIRLVLKIGNLANAMNVVRSAFVWSVVACGYTSLVFYAFVGE